MKLAEKLAEKAYEILKNDGVVISAADFQDGIANKIQLYFLDDENAVASDIIKKIDLLESGVEDIFVHISVLFKRNAFEFAVVKPLHIAFSLVTRNIFVKFFFVNG